MEFGSTARFFIIAMAAMLGVSALTACGGDSKSPTGGSGLEKTHLTVGTLPVADAAPLFIANQRGYFKQEGLTVKPTLIAASSQSTAPLLAGTMDLSLLNYVATFAIQENGSAKFKLVSDAYQAAPNAFEIVVPGDSKLHTIEDLKGKKIACPSLHAIGTLAVSASLQSHGITPDQVTFVAVPFPNMATAVKTHAVDAAWVTEPFLTQMQKSGTRKLTDTMTGPMANFPIVGWGTVEQTAKKYPNTIAAFQRALARGQQAAANDRKVVQDILPTYTQIDGSTANLIALGDYPTTLNPTRLQRVADVMRQFGYLHSTLDVQAMIWTRSQG
jgi:NitT/TauT family transport system substrate-binding protein